MPPDLSGQDVDTLLSAPPTPLPGQSNDWEARFKGLQTRFNEIQSENATLKTQASGKDTLTTNLQTKINDLQSQLNAATLASQGEITTLRADLLGKTSLEQELAAARAEAASLKAAQTTRSYVAQNFVENAAYLMQAMDSGWLGTDGKQGDDLKAHLQGYLDFHGQKAAQAVQQTLKGASPPALSQGDSAKMNELELGEWLMDHDPDDPNYSKFRDAYLKTST